MPAPVLLSPRWSAAILLALALAGPAAAETPRAELGKRLRRFEEAWQEADPVRRAAAVEPMSTAVRSFFTLQLPAAARALDEAWYAVRDGSPPDDDERAAIAVAVTAEPILADSSTDTLVIALEPFYEAPAAAAPGARLHLAILDADGATLRERESDWPAAAGTVRWPTGPLPEGDMTLLVERRDASGDLVIARLALSRADRLGPRLDALPATGDDWPADTPPTVRATVASIVELLRALRASRGQETDYPALRLLRFAESLRAGAPTPGATIATEARAGDVWLSLADARGSVPVRIRAPEKATGPLPVLFLHHGAGGSENMFFDTCGAGRAARLGLERGWLVVAPRQGLFGLPLDVGAMLDLLGESFEIDRERVFLVGHSMGAGQVARQVGLRPDRIAAAVALGGGAAAPTAEAARRVPWFVGAGSADFGRPGAATLAKRLSAGGADATYVEYPDVEHMVVVQAALDDVFRFLDRAAAAGDVSR